MPVTSLPLWVFVFLTQLVGICDLRVPDGDAAPRAACFVGIHPAAAAPDHEVEGLFGEDGKPPGSSGEAWPKAKPEPDTEAPSKVRIDMGGKYPQRKKSHGRRHREQQQQQSDEGNGSEPRGGYTVSADGRDGALALDAARRSPGRQHQKQQQILLRGASVGAPSGVRLSEMPPLAFFRPSLDLVRLTEPLAPPERTPERVRNSRWSASRWSTYYLLPVD